MDYPTLKILHIVAMLVWIVGMLANAIVLARLAASSEPGGAQHAKTIATVRRWERWLIFPAMGLVWAFGLGLAMTGGWLSSRWLMLKLLLVLGLSALHGVQWRALRRFANGSSRPPSGVMENSGPIIVVAVVAIVALAITKPF